MINQLTESRHENGDGVIVIAEIAMNCRRNVTGCGQLFSGDRNAWHADIYMVRVVIDLIFFKMLLD